MSSTGMEKNHKINKRFNNSSSSRIGNGNVERQVDVEI